MARGLPLNPISVGSGMAYLTFLYHRGLQWRTFDISRSAVSQTLPKVDGVAFGSGASVVHLMEGVFNKRPSSRRSFPMWHPDDVFRPFSTWPRPFSVGAVLQWAAFLVVIATCRRLSGCVSLRVDDNFLFLSDYSARFVPTRLSKTDRPHHMCRQSWFTHFRRIRLCVLWRL